MKKLILFLFIPLVFTCSDDEDNTNEQFREIYNNSLWYMTDPDGIIYGNYISFSNDKIMTEYYLEGGVLIECFYHIEGTDYDVDYDGCIYNYAITQVMYEDNDSYTINQSVSVEGNTGTSCGVSDFTINFEVVDESNMTANYLIFDPFSGDFWDETYSLIKVNNNLSNSNCLNASDVDYLW